MLAGAGGEQAGLSCGHDAAAERDVFIEAGNVMR